MEEGEGEFEKQQDKEKEAEEEEKEKEAEEEKEKEAEEEEKEKEAEEEEKEEEEEEEKEEEEKEDIYCKIDMTWKSCKKGDGVSRATVVFGRKEDKKGIEKLFNKDDFANDLMKNGPLCITQLAFVFIFGKRYDEVYHEIADLLHRCEQDMATKVMEGIKKFESYGIAASRSFCIIPTVELYFQTDNIPSSIEYVPPNLDSIKAQLRKTFNLAWINGKTLSPNDKSSLGYVNNMFSKWIIPATRSTIRTENTISLIYLNGVILADRKKTVSSGWWFSISDEQIDHKQKVAILHRDNVIYHSISVQPTKDALNIKGTEMAEILDFMGLKEMVFSLIQAQAMDTDIAANDPADQNKNNCHIS